MSDLNPAFDPRYEFIEHFRFGDLEPYARTKRCLHLDEYVVPVESGGEVVAHLCTLCDAQLP